ncbi:MAG TPA: trigger factor [Candidatus Paceibacterota bacterium]|nr:trigger factor [Candidatus Paceibacterota bacterium]
MQHKIKNLPKAQVELEITLSAQEMEIFWQAAKKKLAENVQLKGFRPGKAPAAILETPEAKDELYNEAANAAIKKAYPDVLAEEELEPLGKIEVEVLKIAPANEFIFRLKAVVLPKPELPPYKDISLATQKGKKALTVKEEEIEEAMAWLRKSRAKINSVERPAQNGDFVEVEIKSALTGAELPKATGPESFILGEGHFLPGFEEKIEGLKVGEKKSFQLKTPADYWDKDLQNKELSFEVQLNKVSERQLPELNDDWAKSLGRFNNLEELKKSISDGLLFEKESKEQERLRALTLEKIVKETKVELPEVLVENEIEHRLHEIGHLAQDNGMTMEDYLKKINKDEKSLREDLRLEAEKTLRGALVLRHISRLERLEPKTEEIEIAMNEFLKHYGEQKEAEKSIDRAALFEYTKERLTNEKVFQFLENLKS